MIPDLCPALFHQAQLGDVGDEAAGLAGHDRVGVTHTEPDLPRREPVYVVNLGADRRMVNRPLAIRTISVG